MLLSVAHQRRRRIEAHGLCVRACDAEQTPLTGNALELCRSTILELQTRARNEVAYGAGHEDLAGLRTCGDARADVHGDARNLPVRHLDLARVQSRSDLETKWPDRVHDRLRAADASRRPVERREEAVARRIDLTPVVAHQLATDRSVMLLEEVTPATVTELGDELGRAREIREEDGRESSVRGRRLTRARQELAYLRTMSSGASCGL